MELLGAPLVHGQAVVDQRGYSGLVAYSATKGGLERPGPDQWDPNGRPERLREGLEGSLRRLGLERIDLWQLHRIDPEVVKRDFNKAGFVLAGTSDMLRNPADDHSLLVFDEKIRGKTDRFVFKFRKPR